MPKKPEDYKPSPWRERGFRIGWSEETIAWKALDFEYTELKNETTLDDLIAFLKVKGGWATVLAEFRRRHGDVNGVWLCKNLADAILYYGRDYALGDTAVYLEYEYDPKNVIIELGADGTFVLEPTFIGEKGIKKTQVMND